MSFDMEPEHQPTKEEWEVYEQQKDEELLRRIWLINPEIKTMQFKKMVFDAEVIAIAKAAIAASSDNEIAELDMQGHIKASGV